MSTATLPARGPIASADPVRVPAPVGEPSALERLAATRGRMRAAMLDYARPAVKRPPPVTGEQPLHDLGEQVVAGLKNLPGIAILAESLQSWWAQHPLRTVAIVAEEASRALVLPVAQRHPVGLVVGAAVAGALVIASRPWRWLLRPALFIGLVPQLTSHIVRRLPVDSWLKMLSSIIGAKPARPTSRPKPPTPEATRASGLPAASL